jgi:GT2 family glycosyltransferase
MSQVLVVIPTILAQPHKYILIDQLVRDPHVARIVIVDNGNCFETPVGREEAWRIVERVRPGCNLNWLASCNLGAILTKERQLPYVCFLNDDTSLSEGFFAGMLQTFERQPKAAVVVPRYNGYFDHVAKCEKLRENWEPEDCEQEVTCCDGTCMLVSARAIETVGLLDPIFRHPGWGADVDYAYRVARAGLKLYVSSRAMLWHAQREGGTSARVVYGDVNRWKARALEQARGDLEAKYGRDWRAKLPIPPGTL